VNLDFRDALGRTPLHYAAMSGNQQALRGLLTAGANINARNVDGDTPLVSAIKFSRLEAVRYLLRKGADPLIPCMGPKIRRRIVASMPHVEMSPPKMYINVEVVARPQQADEYLPIHWAAAIVNPQAAEVIHALLESAPNLPGARGGRHANARSVVGGSNPLLISIRAGDPDKVRYLLEAGADPNLASRIGVHPMLEAAAWGGIQVLEHLIEYGGDVNVTRPKKPTHVFRTRYNLTPTMQAWAPIDEAMHFRNERCAIMLKRAGAETDLERMAHAAGLGMVDLFDLMTGGPTPAARRMVAQRTGDGFSLVHLAAYAPTPHMIRRLVRDYGLDINAPILSYWSAVNLAEEPEVYLEMIKLGSRVAQYKHDYSDS
jgi:ankyrin repeat protein